MLLRPHGKTKRPFTFNQELSFLKKQNYAPAQFQKSQQNFKLTLNILGLLVEKVPAIAQELFTVKRSLSKWYEHVRQEKITKNMEIMKIKDEIIVGIKKEIGIVLEQIAYNIRAITEEYNDKNLEIYYVRYLNALKKLEWSSSMNQKSSERSIEVQTDEQDISIRILPTQRSIEKESLSTIESPEKTHKDLLQKCLQTKEDNFELEKKCNKLEALLKEKEYQCNSLKVQLQRLFDQNSEQQAKIQHFEQEVSQLKEKLNQLKLEDEERRAKQAKLNLSLEDTQKKYQRFHSLQDCLHRQLSFAQEELNQKESQISLQENFFNKNYKISKETNEEQFHRFIFMQALVVQDFIAEMDSFSGHNSVSS